jgi:CBS domain-containing protein
MPIKTISDLIDGRALVSLAPEATVREICETLSGQNIGAVAIVEASALVGIVSERDLIRRCFCKGKSDDTRARDVMTPAPRTLTGAASLADAMQTMIDGGFRHVPVVDQKGLPVGMVSMRDIPTENRLMVERFREYRAEMPMAAQ